MRFYAPIAATIAFFAFSASSEANGCALLFAMLGKPLNSPAYPLVRQVDQEVRLVSQTFTVAPATPTRAWGAIQERLLNDLLRRYYTSFNVRMGLLSSKVGRQFRRYNLEILDDLLPIESVVDPDFPRLLPLNSVHKDSHYMRSSHEFEEITDHSYFESSAIDLPNKEVVTRLDYQFPSHGDSSRTRHNFIGRRFEYIEDWGQNGQTAYSKIRFNEAGEVVAQTLVVKVGDSTIRYRLDPRAEVEDVRRILLFAHRTMNFRDTPVSHFQMRYHVQMVTGADLANPIGNVSIDLKLKPNGTEVKDGRKYSPREISQIIQAPDQTAFDPSFAIQVATFPERSATQKQFNDDLTDFLEQNKSNLLEHFTKPLYGD